MGELTFRPLARGDLPLLHEWLQRPHVKRWWSDHDTLEEVTAHYVPSLDGIDPSYHYLALDGGVPIGFFQTYLYWDYPTDAAAAGIDHGAAGVDLFIADETRLGRGLGSDLLRRFVDEYALALSGVTHCAAEPEEANVASIRAFEKAGFHVVRAFDDLRDGKRHVLVRKDRSRPEAASQHALERT
ncbi:MAG TPA: GNAT family N-acetyltransferase [Gaiellaceae bacterium]|nr:GNAT family N-acetyltransferase [Gaiellaceae bacterium]